MEKLKPKVIIVCGPTATGKSDYAVQLAMKILPAGGEVISADSRQIYRGMDLGTGKITVEEMQGIPHHLLDIKNPEEDFSVEEYKKLADEKIVEIIARGKTPILCGGTGFFIQAVIDNISFPHVPPNPALRTELESLDISQLFARIVELDPDRAATIDLYNKRRLVRALEIIDALGHVPKTATSESPYEFEIKYIDRDDDELRSRIEKRLLSRLDQGMINEVENLHDNGISWERLENFGLEYRYIAEFLQNKISRDEMIETLKHKIWQYAKRQRTWFKKYLNKN